MLNPELIGELRQRRALVVEFDHRNTGRLKQHCSRLPPRHRVQRGMRDSPRSHTREFTFAVQLQEKPVCQMKVPT